jgi:DNA-binding transcriptional regulator YhcF (GntR family)
MHTAFITGKLSWALFSVQDVAVATGLDRRMIKKAFIDLKRGGYVHFLKRESLYNIVSIIQEEPPLETAQTLARYYVINTDLGHITANLLDMLTKFYTEKHTRKGLAKPTRDMAEQIGIEDYTVFKNWIARYDAAKDDLFTREAAIKLRQEFDGDGHDWHGWHAALQSAFTLDIDWGRCETIKDVRGQLLLQWINIRDCNTQDELCRIAGCTEATLASVFAAHNIATIAQTEKIELDADFEDLRDTMRETQRSKRCMIWRVSFKNKADKDGTGGWSPVDVGKAALLYARNSERITKVLLIVNKPSVQKQMTPEQIEMVSSLRAKITEAKAAIGKQELTDDQKDTLKQAKKAVRSAALKLIPNLIDLLNAIIETYGDTPLDTAIENMKPVTLHIEPRARKQAVTVKSRNWQTHDPVFLHRKLSEEIYMYTPHELIGECVYDNDKNLIFKASGYNLGTLVEWLNQNASDKPIRSSADFHGIEIEDYSDDIRLELKTRYDRKMKKMYDNLVPDFDMPGHDKVIPMPLPEPQVIDDRTQAMLDFCTGRLERELGNRLSPFKLEPRPSITKSWIDKRGYLHELRGDDLYVDGIKQVMSDTVRAAAFAAIEAMNRTA